MNRRTFLQAIGLVIAAPGAALGAVKPKGGIILPKYPSLGDKATTTGTVGCSPLWSRHLFDYALKDVMLPKYLMGDQWVPPLKGPNDTVVFNRIRPK